MSRLLNTLAIAAALAIGVATSAVQAQQAQPTPVVSSTEHGMQQHGMMGGLMGEGDQNGSGNIGDMMGTMRQMSQMMEHCHQMMESHMQGPNSQRQKPGEKG